MTYILNCLHQKWPQLLFLFSIADDLVNASDLKVKYFTNAFNRLQLRTKTEAVHNFKKPLISRGLEVYVERSRFSNCDGLNFGQPNLGFRLLFINYSVIPRPLESYWQYIVCVLICSYKSLLQQNLISPLLKLWQLHIVTFRVMFVCD